MILPHFPRLLPMLLLSLIVSGCWWPETSSMRHEALNERCRWMGQETMLFAEARDKGTTRDDALKQASVAEANEPQQAQQNRQAIGVPGAADDIREIVHQVYDVYPKIPPNDLAGKVEGGCTSSIPE